MRIVSTGQQKTGLASFLEHIGIPLLCLFGVALSTGLFFDRYCPQYSIQSSGSYDFSCAADGTVIYPLGGCRNQCWNPKLFLSITLASGKLTFPQAKAVDICWDLVVGRGGQMLLSVLTYPVIRKSLITLLEKRPLRMPLVTSLTFEHFSMRSWWALTKNLVHSWSWRLFGYLYVVIYLLAFGTLVSAMTGYQANMAPFYRADGNLMDYSKVQVVEASVILDADRVGLEPTVTVYSSQRDPNYPLWNCTYHAPCAKFILTLCQTPPSRAHTVTLIASTDGQKIVPMVHCIRTIPRMASSMLRTTPLILRNHRTCSRSTGL